MRPVGFLASESEALIGVVRSHDGLRASTTRQDTPSVAGADGPVVHVQPALWRLEIVPRALCPDRDRLLASWHALEWASTVDAGTLTELLVLLIETVPLRFAEAPLPPPLDGPGEPAAPRATAAHPRAFRGTKRKPPRPPRAPVRDLRGGLGDARWEQALLRALAPHLANAIEALARRGYDRARLERLRGLPADVYFAYHFDGGEPPRFPAAFATDVLPALRGASRRTLGEHLALYRALELDARPELLALVSRLVAVQSDARTLGWLGAVAQTPPELRAAFVNALLAGGYFTVGPDELRGFDVAAFLSVTPPEFYARRLLVYLWGLRAGISAGYLMDGFRLANAYEPGCELRSLASDVRPALYTPAPALPPGDDYSADVAAEVLAHLAPAPRDEWLWCSELWVTSGQLPGFGEILRRGDWRTLSPQAARLFLSVFSTTVHDDPRGLALQAKWRVLAREASEVARMARSAAPRYQDKLLSCVSEVFRRWDEPKQLTRLLPPAYRLIARLAAEPFREESAVLSPLAAILEGDVAGAEIERLLAAPDGCYRALEAACRRENDARLIWCGLDALARRVGAFTVGCFLEHPGALFRAARMLGCLRPASRERVAQALAGHPLQRLDVPALPIAEAVAQLRALGGGLANPVPRRLREHLDGEVALTAEQVRRHAGRVAARIGQTRLELLEELVLDELAQGLPVPDERDPHRHTLQMVPWSDGNRRALRRFLKAHWGGDTRYLRDHPVSRAWLARHPELDALRWTEGIELAGPTEAHGAVRLTLERDPLEALKLGTYVGSCLGLGGICSYSASAVVLDINKQVLYARDAEERVLARQLVAISSAGRLVCFRVYPESADAGVRALFGAYDQRFAEALGVPLEGEDDEATIEFVLAAEWWDDGSVAPPASSRASRATRPARTRRPRAPRGP